MVLQGLVSCIALQLLSHFWSRSIAIRDIIRMKQSDWSATIVVHGTKIEQAVDQAIFPLCVRKLVWARDHQCMHVLMVSRYYAQPLSIT